MNKLTQTGHNIQDSNTGSPTLKGNKSQCFGGDMDLIELIKSTTYKNNHTLNVNAVYQKKGEHIAIESLRTMPF